MDIKSAITTPFNKIPPHLFVAISGWISKIIIASVQIISIRALLSYLGEDRYAVYAIAFSIVSWSALTELSIGTSLQNFISESRAKNENYDKYLKACLQIIIILFVIFSIVIIFISNPVQNIIFRKFTNISEIQTTHIILTGAMIYLAYALTFPVYKVYYALHKGYVSNFLQALSAIISMAAIVIFKRHYPEGHSITTALIIFTLPLFLCAAPLFIKIFASYLPRIFEFDIKTIKNIFIRAVKFHSITIFTLIFLQTDYLVMSQTLKPADIVTYSIFMKVFMFIVFIYIAVLAAVWPVFSEMYVRKEFNQIKSMIKKYNLLVLILSIAGTAFIYIFSPVIIKILAPGTQIDASPLLILMFGIFILLRCYCDTFLTFLQSINALRTLFIYMPFQIALNASAQYFLSKNYGVKGILAGLIISLVLTAFWILPLKTKAVLKTELP
ncbi:MAG: MATE family efflux transporter [Endomicrobia bacterium]|nr:MATE family efflux transporter [Endomicrobiia bacterium]MCL2799003.1 MATE family efflux transporter [Endomicrobiia bacterium]